MNSSEESLFFSDVTRSSVGRPVTLQTKTINEPTQKVNLLMPSTLLAEMILILIHKGWINCKLGGVDKGTFSCY